MRSEVNFDPVLSSDDIFRFWLLKGLTQLVSQQDHHHYL